MFEISEQYSPSTTQKVYVEDPKYGSTLSMQCPIYDNQRFPVIEPMVRWLGELLQT